MTLPRMVNDKKLKNIQWHLQEQRQRLHENVLLRKSMLEANYASQMQREKDDIRSRIARLQPGVQKTFLRTRLEKFDKR
jgi:hypothetical protein